MHEQQFRMNEIFHLYDEQGQNGSSGWYACPKWAQYFYALINVSFHFLELPAVIWYLTDRVISNDDLVTCQIYAIDSSIPTP